MDELGGDARIRLSGPAGLLAAVPSLLGFHPGASIVLVCMTGDRNTVGPVARVDLPPGPDSAVVAELTGTALTHADRVAVICYPPRRRRPAILTDLLGALAHAGVGVTAVLVVHGGRVWDGVGSGPLRLPDSRPMPDHRHPTAQAFAATNAWEGRVVLADRAALRASIAGPRGRRRRLAAQAVDAVIGGRPCDLPIPPGRPRSTRSFHRPGLPPPSPYIPLPERIGRLLDCALDQVARTGQVDVHLSAELAVACLDARVRDGVVLRGLFELDRIWLAMLISCAGWTTDDLAPGVCAVLAVLAYRFGDGGLAQVAVDRCLLAEPGNRLVQLLMGTMAAGLPPSVLDRLLMPPDEAVSGPATGPRPGSGATGEDDGAAVA